MRTPVLALLLLAAPLAAQQPYQPQQLTAQDYARAERFLGATAVPLVTGLGVQPTWLEDGRFWYRATTAAGNGFFVVDPASGSQGELFDHARLAAALAAVTGGRVEPTRLPFPTLEMARDGRSITVEVQERRWRCDVQRYACEPADPAAGTAAAPPSSSVSPDGRWAAFIRDHDLWARDLASGRDVRLTTDGVEGFGYATDNAGWTHSDRPVLTWSPDSRRIATFQHDSRGVGDMHLVTTNVGRPELESWPYPVPGDSVIFRISRVVIDLGEDGANPSVVRFRMPPDPHRSTVSDHVACAGGEICDVQWYPDGSHVAFVSSSRDHKTATVRVADARTGEVRTLLEETMPTQVGDAAFPEDLWRVLPASDELIWWSQRDDWTHLYLYDLSTGRLKNRITRGEGNVTEVVRVDEEARVIYFLGQGKEPGRDPYYQHLYRIGFDGRGETLLTPEDANHEVWSAPDGRHFVDSYSTPQEPPVTVLRDAAGRIVQTLVSADASPSSPRGGGRPPPSA